MPSHVGGPIPSDADVEGYLSSLSNWGRWGDDDQLGTLRLIGPDERKAAVATVTEGVVVSCAVTIEYGRLADDPNPLTNDTRPHLQPSHYMLRSGEAADPNSSTRLSPSDTVLLPIHGLGLTHIDAPCHTIFKGQIYNGHSASQIQTAAGALVGSIELVSDGIVGRAVLLDVPASQGRSHLDDGEAVHPDDLDRCEEVQRVRVSSGDILLVRTGYRLHSPRGPATRAGGYPGLQAACLPWLYERDVALLATDTAADVHPNDYSMGMPIHTVGMWAMGLWLVDNCSFEQLAAECAARGRWEMLFVIAPLTLSVATGSPINPLAVF